MSSQERFGSRKGIWFTQLALISRMKLEDTGQNIPYYENLKKIIRKTIRCEDVVKCHHEIARPIKSESLP